MFVLLKLLAAGWLVVGIPVALGTILFGLHRPAIRAEGGSIPFRVIVLPGAILLWPLVVLALLAKEPIR